MQWNYKPCYVGPPKTDESCGEFWKNRIHWRREWQTTSVFLSWEPYEQYEKAKRYDTEDELPRLIGALYARGEEWRNSSRKNEEAEPKQKQCPVVDVTGDGSKAWCCKEQYFTRTWNVRSMKQGKLEVKKQEMARVNINILGIRELKWMGMGEFNSDTPVGRNPLEEWSSHHSQQKSLKCSTWMQSQKWQNDLCSFPGQTIHIAVIQVYALTRNAEEAEVEGFYEDLQDLLELTPKKDVLFIIGDWNAK